MQQNTKSYVGVICIEVIYKADWTTNVNVTLKNYYYYFFLNEGNYLNKNVSSLTKLKSKRQAPSWPLIGDLLLVGGDMGGSVIELSVEYLKSKTTVALRCVVAFIGLFWIYVPSWNSIMIFESNWESAGKVAAELLSQAANVDGK